jgi:hypothetical protein
VFAPSTRRSSDSLARGLPRLLSTLLVLSLLGGTAAAFAVTERLKLVPSPIIAPKVTPAFSPVCRGGCTTREARIRFGLRDADRLTVTIIDEDDDPVATIADAESLPAGPVEFVWDGRAAPEGVYRARVHLADARRTIDVPNEMRLDTTPPTLTVERIGPTTFSPDGDGRADKVSAEYSVSERAKISLHHGDDTPVVSPPRSKGKIDWYARGLLPGVYVVSLSATDLAGNTNDRLVAPTEVRLRFVELSPRRIVVPAGVRFGVGVSTDARRYRWRLGSRTGSSSGRSLALLSPALPGRYTLTVSYAGHRDAIPVFVRAQP